MAADFITQVCVAGILPTLILDAKEGNYEQN
jgi:hypothetical protein